MTSTRTVHRIAALLLLVATASLTSCIKVDADATVTADGSGRITAELELGEQLTAALTATGDTAVEAATQQIFGDDAPADAKVSVDGTKVSVDVPFGTVEEFETILTGGDVALFSSVDLRNESGRWQFDATVNTAGDPADRAASSSEPVQTADPTAAFTDECNAGAGQLDATDEELVCVFPDGRVETQPLPEDTGVVEPALNTVISAADGETADGTFSLTLPAAVGTTNATSADGNTATWDLELGDGTQQLNATAGEPEAGLVAGVPNAAVAAALLIIVLVAAAVLTERRRRRRDQDDDAAPAAETDEQHVGTDPVDGAATESVAGVESLPGWYPDPAGSDDMRYWDGTDWTDELRDRSGFDFGAVEAAPDPADVGAREHVVDSGIVIDTELAHDAPQIPAGDSGPDAGWYPDPHSNTGMRYWDGTGWTDEFQSWDDTLHAEPEPAPDLIPAAVDPAPEPVPAATAAPDAGWYADPLNPDGRRYWDGTDWTDQVG